MELILTLFAGLRVGFADTTYTVNEGEGGVTLIITSNGVNEATIQVQLSTRTETASGIYIVMCTVAALWYQHYIVLAYKLILAM